MQTVDEWKKGISVTSATASGGFQSVSEWRSSRPLTTKLAEPVSVQKNKPSTETADAVHTALTTPPAEKSFDMQPALSAGWDVLSTTIQDTAKKFQNFSKAWNTPSTGVQKTVATGEAALATINNLFALPAAFVTSARHIPVVGYVADGVNNFFAALGEVGKGMSGDIVEKLPFSEETKDEIRPMIEEFGALTAQLVGGKLGGDVVSKTTRKAQEIVNTVNKGLEGAKAMSEVRTIPVTGESVTQNVPIKIPERLRIEAGKQNIQLPAPEAWLQLPQAKEGGYPVQGKGFVMTDKPDAQKVALGKSMQAYKDAIEKYNKKSTPENLASALKAGEKAAKLDTQFRDTQIKVAEQAKPMQNVPIKPMSVAEWKEAGKPSVAPKTAPTAPIAPKVDVAPLDYSITYKDSLTTGEKANIPLNKLESYVTGLSSSEGRSALKGKGAVSVELDADGKLHILDGNNRIQQAIEDGYTHIPARVMVDKGAESHFASLVNKASTPSPSLTSAIQKAGSKEVAPTPAPTPKPVETTGKAVSGIAKSIQQKAVDSGVTPGFDKLAGYDPITWADQFKRASDVINADINNARAMMRGEIPMAEGLKGEFLLAKMEEYILKNPEANKNGELSYELANSKVATEVSEAAQTLGAAGAREADSVSAKLQTLAKSRATRAGNVTRKTEADITKTFKGEVDKINLPKAELAWDKFLNDIIC